MNVLIGILIGLFPWALIAWLVRRVKRTKVLSERSVVVMAALGWVLGSLAFHLERAVLSWAELSILVSVPSMKSGLLAMLLVKAPIQESLKVLPLWFLLGGQGIGARVFRLRSAFPPPQGLDGQKSLLLSAVVATGFASASGAWFCWLAEAPDLSAAKSLFAFFGHLFFAGAWGYALGSPSLRSRWFGWVWLVSALLHGLFSYLVFARGAGMLLVCIPIVLFMGVVGFAALREVTRVDASSPEVLELTRRRVPSSFLPISQAKATLRAPSEPVALFWIGLGVLVTFGVMIALLGLSVYAGHRLGVDFTLADESDVRSSGPLLLLGSGFILAFPTAGYLVAKASGRSSILEAAIATGIAIGLVIAMLWLTAPVAVVFGLVVAPLAFALACAGAWFGARP